VEGSWRLTAFAFAVHAAMFLPMLLHALHQAREPATASRVGALLLTLVLALSTYMLWQVVRRVQPMRTRWLSAHLFVLLLAPLLFYSSTPHGSPALATLAVCGLLVPLAAEERMARAAIRFAGRVWKSA
jgi:hypothetical protein